MNIDKDYIFNKIGSSKIITEPFDHVIIDDFFTKDNAMYLESYFPKYDDDIWHVYSNPIEEKKTCNQWNLFPSPLYSLFQLLNSYEFVSALSTKFNLNLSSDCGLHGGGLHIHSSGGNLNPHLDYSIHPKLGLQRKLNIIIYVSSDEGLLNSEEGDLGLWYGDSHSPTSLCKSILPKFNRAIIFDTTQNSWHGIVKPLSKCANYTRKSFASYYLQIPTEFADNRTRALFAPRDFQVSDKHVLDVIKKRSSEASFSSVYKV